MNERRGRKTYFQSLNSQAIENYCILLKLTTQIHTYTHTKIRINGRQTKWIYLLMKLQLNKNEQWKLLLLNLRSNHYSHISHRLIHTHAKIHTHTHSNTLNI